MNIWGFLLALSLRFLVVTAYVLVGLAVADALKDHRFDPPSGFIVFLWPVIILFTVLAFWPMLFSILWAMPKYRRSS